MLTQSPVALAISSPVQIVSNRKRFFKSHHPAEGFHTNLLGRQTQRTDLGGKCRLSSNLTTGGTEVDDLHLIGVEFGSYSQRKKILMLAIAWQKNAATKEMILTHGEGVR